MRVDLILNESELKELEKLAQKNNAAKKALSLIEIVQGNPAINSYVALFVTHDKICNELLENDVKLFNTDPEYAKTFDSYLKWKDKVTNDVEAINTLRNKLLPEEQVKANKKVKDSSQLFLPKSIIS